MRRSCWMTWGVMAVVVLLAGCGGGSSQEPVEVKATSPESARQALEATLTAWKEGKAPSALEQHDPPIQVSDSVWSGGAKIEGYEIGKEEPFGAGRDFLVKLSVTGKGAQQAHYIVNGQNPVKILRDIDFQRELRGGNATPSTR